MAIKTDPLAHTCHATGCNKAVPEKMFMCYKHWKMLPRRMQNAIWAAYRPGQEIDKMPSFAYLRIAGQCIEYIAEKEGRRSVLPD